jgi:hypothetical protein
MLGKHQLAENPKERRCQASQTKSDYFWAFSKALCSELDIEFRKWVQFSKGCVLFQILDDGQIPENLMTLKILPVPAPEVFKLNQ